MDNRITLPSGRTAELVPAKGRHMVEAAKVCNPSTDQLGYSFALIAHIILMIFC